MTQKAFTLQEVVEITKLAKRTLYKYLKEIDIETTVYSSGKIQITEEGLEKLKEYAKEKAKQNRKIRRENIEKVRFTRKM